MKTIAIIPARGGSKRLPGKNLLPLGGLPLIAHSILYAQANPDIIDAVFVTTNDPEIRKVAREYGAEVIDRPAELSGDLEPTSSALRHAVLQLDSDVENIVLLQPTNPLRPANLLAEAFEQYQNRNAPSLFTVTRSERKLGKIENNRFCPTNYTFGQRSQDLEPQFYENGLLYISRRSLILNNEIIRADAFPFEIDPDFPIVDIDSMTDYKYAQYLYNLKKQG
ncbi:MAG: acylneuraminate cytidylyltransferase family protein [Flavobacterium sp.]|nr:acylneuraminate cytidylyltransferase family protein [Flavobacterium sp.]